MKFSHLHLLITALVLIALGLFSYKLFWLKLPFFPDVEADLWVLETEMRFDADGGPVKVALSLPEDQANYQILHEYFIGRDYGRKTSDKPGRRRSTWSLAHASGVQTIYYRAIISPRYGGTQPEVKQAESPAADFEGILAAAADALVAELREKSADLDSMMTELAKRLGNPASNDNLAVFFTEPNPTVKVRAQVAAQLLRHAGYAARSVNGFKLQDGVNDTPVLNWLEVWSEGHWQAYSVVTGEPEMPQEYLIWWYGSNPMARLLCGGQDFTVRTSISRDRSRLIRTVAGGGRHARSFLTAFSPFSLPLRVQSVYKTLLLVPMGVLIMVLFRNVIGLETFGTFMPVLIALSFRQTGIGYGIALLLSLITVGLFLRFYLAQLKLLMVPRLASVLTVVVLLMLAISILARRLDLGRGLSVALFPLVILTMTIEQMSVAWEEFGGAEAIKLGMGSLVVALCTYPIIANPLTEHLLFVFPELLLLVLSATLMIGRYTNFRLLELLRFRDLAKGASHD